MKPTACSSDVLILCVFIKDYKDHGDYWRANYETIDDPKYAYTRDELMTDVRRIYTEVCLICLFFVCLFFFFY